MDQKPTGAPETVQDMLKLTQRTAFDPQTNLDLEDRNFIDVQEENAGLLHEYGLYAALKYATLTCSCPFKNAIILQQVQYSPNDYFFTVLERKANQSVFDDNIVSSSENDDVSESGSLESEYLNNDDRMMGDLEREVEEMMNESSSDAGDEPMEFGSKVHSSRRLKPTLKKRQAVIKSLPKDSDGYLIPCSAYESEEWFRLGKLDNNIFHTVLAVCRHPDEGFFSLWKGQFTSWFYDMLYFLLQPSIETSLGQAFSLEGEVASLSYLDSVGPSLFALMFSEIVTGWVLSPLETARTRLVVQSSASYKKKYHGVFHSLKTMTREEGVYNMYFGINLVPTLLYHAVVPISKELVALFIERVLCVDFVEQPVRYLLWESFLGLAELMVTLPLQTIRRRLQCQIEPCNGVSNTHISHFNTVVARSDVPYRGLRDCFRRIVCEEGGYSSKTRKQRLKRVKTNSENEATRVAKERPAWRSWISSYGKRWGLAPLYGGVFQLHVASKFVKLMINLLNVIEVEIEEE